MNREYEVCRIAVEWQNDDSIDEFEKNLMKAIQHADDINIKKLFKEYPYHVEAFLRYRNLHDNPIGLEIGDNPDWYKETEADFWHNQEMEEELGVSGFYENQGK